MSDMGHSAEKGLLVPSHWNPHWNYRLGGEPRSICACPDGPYVGAALVGTPPYCERCGGLLNAAVTYQSPGGRSLTHCCCDRTTARLVVCPVHPEARQGVRIPRCGCGAVALGLCRVCRKERP